MLLDKHYHVISNRLFCEQLKLSTLDEFSFAKYCSDTSKISFIYNNHGNVQLPYFVFSIDPTNHSLAFLEEYFTTNLDVRIINRECSIFIDFFLGKYEHVNELFVPLNIKLDLSGFKQIWDEIKKVTIIYR